MRPNRLLVKDSQGAIRPFDAPSDWSGGGGRQQSRGGGRGGREAGQGEGGEHNGAEAGSGGGTGTRWIDGR